MAADQSLVTDKAAANRKGWRQARYGRAVAIMRVRKPDGQVIVVDPVHYKAGLERLFGTVKPKPLNQLDWGEAVANASTEAEEIFAQGELEVEFADSTGSEAEQAAKMEIDDIQDAASTDDRPEEEEETKKGTEMDVDSSVEESSKLVSAQSGVDEVVPPPLDSSIQIQMTVAAGPAEEEDANDDDDDEYSVEKQPSVEPYKVNVSWNQLFTPSSFSLNLFGSPQTGQELTPASKDKNEEDRKADSPAPAATKARNFNFAHLFASSPSVERLFGCTAGAERDAAIAEWRDERYDLKLDYRKKVNDGKRKQRKRNQQPNLL